MRRSRLRVEKRGRPIELLGGHDAGKTFAAGLAGEVASSDRTRIPGVSRDVIEGDTQAFLVKVSEVRFGRGVALFSRKGDPMCALRAIEVNAKTVEVEQPEVVLSDRMTEEGSGAKPASRLRQITGDAEAVEIESADIVLSGGIAPLGSGEIEVEGFGEVHRNAEAMLIERGKIVLGDGMAVEGGSLVEFGGFGVVGRDTVAVLAEIAEEKLRVGIALRGGAEPCEG